jgi:integrase
MSNLPKFYLFKRNNGIYYVGYFENGRKRWKSTGATLKADAHKAVSNLAGFLKDKLKEVTLGQFKAEFIPFAEGNYSKCTVEFYKAALERLLEMAGDCPLSGLTMQHVDNYKVNRLGVGKVSGVTVNRELQALRAAMNTGVSWKLLESNPFAKLQQVSIPERQPEFFTKNDFEKLLGLIGELWLKELVIIAALTGMRRGELVNLRWSDVDLSRRVIQIQSSATFRTKKGKRRAIPLSDIAFTILSTKAARTTNEYVFTKNGRRINDDHATKKLKKYVVQGKLPKGLHFHSLRHTFASWPVQDGVSLYEVQKLLGHSSSVMTQVYSHLQPEQLHQTVNRLQFALN